MDASHHALLIALLLAGATALTAATGTPVAQLQAAQAPAAPSRFRYDETSGKCLDAEGREGYNRSTREDLLSTGDAECADLTGSKKENLTYLRLDRANLRGANFDGALFYLGAITNSDLTGAKLSGTSGQMEYRGSRLRKATLAGADLTYADFRDADLDGADLRGARFSPHTRLPFDHDEALRRGMVFAPKP